jgi:hypothetical protein
MRQLAFVLVALTLACAPAQPPGPAVQREGTEVPASFGRTWDAVITTSSAECSTKGRWETEFEERILARATAPR